MWPLGSAIYARKLFGGWGAYNSAFGGYSPHEKKRKLRYLVFLGSIKRKEKKMREVHAEYIRETPNFVHVSMDITPADANKSSYSYGPWTLRKAEEPAPVSTSTHDKIAWKPPNKFWSYSFGGPSVKNNTKDILANVGTSYDDFSDGELDEGDSEIFGLLTGLGNSDDLDLGLRGEDMRKLQLVSGITDITDITDIRGIYPVKLRDFVHLDFWFYTGPVFASITEHILRAARDEGVSERGCEVRATTTTIASSAMCVSPSLLSSTEGAWHDKPSFGTFSSDSSVGVDFTQYKEARCLLSYIALKALDPVESELSEEGLRQEGRPKADRREADRREESSGPVWIFYTDHSMAEEPKGVAFGWHV